jgi:hypothetical protein
MSSMVVTYYFSTQGCTLVFWAVCFSALLDAAPFAAAAFRALRSKKFDMAKSFVATGEASLWIGRGYRISSVSCILVKRCAGGVSRLNAWSLGSRHFSYALVGRVWRSSRRAMPPRSRQGSYLLCGASNPMCTLCSRCQTGPGTLPASCNHARPFPLTPGKTRVSSLVVTKAPRCDSLHQRGAIGIENKRVICRRRETTCFASNKPAKRCISGLPVPFDRSVIRLPWATNRPDRLLVDPPPTAVPVTQPQCPALTSAKGIERTVQG